MSILRIKKIHEDVEMPVMNSYGIFDIRVHSFHKITEYDGIVAHNTNTFGLTAHDRVIIKTGYSIDYCSNLPNKNDVGYYIQKHFLQITSRMPCLIKDGLTVLGGIQLINIPENTGELQIVLYNSSDNFILLKKGYRVAQAMITQVHENRIENI